MKLRQKSYLLSTLLVTGALFLCASILLLPSIRATVRSVEARAFGEEKALAVALDSLLTSTVPEDRERNARMFSAYDSDALFAVGSGSAVWYATDPQPSETEPGKTAWIARGGRTYLSISDMLSNGVFLRYELDVTDEVRRIARQATGSILLCTLITGAIAVALYVVLERVNRPVERLAHELRTPLTVIRGYGELLERAKLTPEQQHRAASYIVTESERLGEISQKLLTLADARKNVFRPEHIRLSELAAHLSTTYPTLETDIAWESLTADRALLLSLLGNLIGNAVKASAPGAPVTMRATPGVIEIVDAGSGMTAEQLRYVNDPAHAKNPNARSGLGIPLCHEIAALHQATLHFTSEPGKGTTATVTFGAQRSDVPS